MNLLPVLMKDVYKTDHKRQYPDGCEEVYSNLTARGSRDPEIKSVVVFGFQGFVLEYLIERFNRDFFAVPRHTAVKRYKRRIDNALGKDAVPVEHIGELHDLGYLPMHVKALPEGTLCPIGIPMLTMKNTLPQFFWLTNFLETLLSCQTWKTITNATIAFEYRKFMEAAALETNPEMVAFAPWQSHDFSMRGMDGVDSAARSGAAHLLSNTGTDTYPGIDYLEEYYGADSDKELVGGSVAATEHSVMCMGGKETELQTFQRLLALYPTGVLSVVSDTWDYWQVLTVLAVQLKDRILTREGKLVFRPDSGDPFKIICGDPDAPEGSPQQRGSVQVLWELFGGTMTSKGFKQLDAHVGLIYGDSITLALAKRIINRLRLMGFASTNLVLGVGSFTYQYNTRDTFGMAIKATHGIIKGVGVELFKDPKTDSGLKRSAKGYLRVNADLSLSQSVTADEEKDGLLQTIFLNGKAENLQTLAQIRARLLSNL